MFARLTRSRRSLSVILGVLTLLGCVVLLVWDIAPSHFPAGAHASLGAYPLAMIAVAYIVYQVAHRPSRLEFLKAAFLALAFLLWAANQFWPDSPQATLYNDLAIVLFVLDVFLVLIGWPPASPDESFAETYSGPHDRRAS